MQRVGATPLGTAQSLTDLSHKLFKSNQSNQIKSNHLLLSHHHGTSALVSEILMSVLQTVQKKKKKKKFTFWCI